jgi:hypothetical protein
VIRESGRMGRPALKEAIMIRRSHILTTAALLAVCATPASAATYEELRSGGAAAGGDVAAPPSSIAASAADEYKDVRSPYGVDRDRWVLNRDYGSPDAADAARDLTPVPVAVRPGRHSQPGPYTDSERRLVESPEVQDMVRRISREIRETPTVVVAGEPSGAFDWGDAGIGAAGMLALFSIAAGSALLLGGRRRRRGVRVATR